MWVDASQAGAIVGVRDVDHQVLLGNVGRLGGGSQLEELPIAHGQQVHGDKGHPCLSVVEDHTLGQYRPGHAFGGPPAPTVAPQPSRCFRRDVGCGDADAQRPRSGPGSRPSGAVSCRHCPGRLPRCRDPTDSVQPSGKPSPSVSASKSPLATRLAGPSAQQAASGHPASLATAMMNRITHHSTNHVSSAKGSCCSR